MSEDQGGAVAAGDRRADAEAHTGLTLDDLAALDRDFDGVDAALARLADGTYWTDEVTGQPLPADVLEADPIARRSPQVD